MAQLRVKAHLITGLLTIIPLWVTWLVFKFLLGILVQIGTPPVTAFLQGLDAVAPQATVWLDSQWLLYLLALVMTLVVLFLIGVLARLVVGQRIIHAFEVLLARIPLVHTIYGGTKKLLAVLQSKPDNVQRVVLVDFPREGMKVVGLVTRVMTEEGTGRAMAAVYIPTTPNPTSGYLEVVPVDDLTPTDWSMDQAMAFIISGGAVAPDTLPGPPPRTP